MRFIKYILAGMGLFLLSGLAPLFATEMLQLNEDQPQLDLADANINTDDTLNVNDLGFTQSDLESNLTQQQLNTRQNMLNIHQILGMATEVPMLAEFIVGIATANNLSHGGTDTSLVTNLGWATTALYGATAAFEIFAPKPEHNTPNGNTGIHVALSWIHLPLMILVPLTGDMINDRLANHEPLGNLPTVHGVMATALLVSYSASLIVITF